ncbi:unnamed protein product [Rotaria sp. Silwood1]|nr:unnamed protein product [Rotaria sp. Silwood1]
MRIHFKQSVLLIICLICILIGIYSWHWWKRYKLIINRFIHATPKTNLDNLEEAILFDNKLLTKCQHFTQGKQSFVVDSKGYLCERRHLEKTNGCCQLKSSSIRGPYICDSCSSTTHCCSSFEHCISCCLKPDHRIYLQNYIRSRDLKTSLLLSHLSTSFDICLSRCRTHSNSILNDLEPILAIRTREQFHNRHRHQILIELLGTQFQWKFFRLEPDIPHILISPYMFEDHRRKLENEAKSWLQIQVFKAAVDIGATVTEDQDTNRLSNDMKNFLEYTYEIVCKSFERYLYQIQHKEEIMKQEEEEEKKLQEINKTKNQYELISQSKFRAILRDSQINSKKLPIINELSSTPHPMTSQYSNIISKSIVALLKCDLRRIIFIKEKLFGQQLPLTIRQFIWTECLLRFEKEPLENDFNFVEFQARRDFAAGVTRGKHELKLKNPSNTPVTNVIENAVIETYSKIHALHPYLEEQHLRFTIKILNILYTYRKDYQPYFIYWLLPFQLSYNNNENKNEELYIIAMHFNLFIHHCFLQWSNIYTIANEIMIDLSTNDQEFYEHLKSISNIRKKNINPRDFFKEIISLENISNNNSIQYTNDLISDPVIFLRKWISQMFVGIINCNSVLYLWDQFFMIKWNIIYIKYATITILYLLRNRFMYAKDYNDMRKIFLDEPYLLHTLDIQRAFIHLAIKNYNPKYISDMNQRLYISKSLNNIRYLTNKQKTYLETMGIKDISLNLIIPITDDFQQEFNYKSLIVEIQIHEDVEILSVISTKSIPIIQNQQTIHKWQKITIDIPNDKLIVSIRQSHQSLIPTRIQALVLVHQRLDAVTQKTLGYCRFPLYIPQKIGNLDTWEVTFGPVKRALHPGVPILSIDMIPDIPQVFVADTIGPGSTISLVVFDPKTEQYSYS